MVEGEKEIRTFEKESTTREEYSKFLLKVFRRKSLNYGSSSNFSSNVKQIFYAFLFNIRNYSLEAINIQQREAELNIILPRVNNFEIKQKSAWNISFYYIPPAPNKILGQSQQVKVNFIDNTTFFFF